MADEPVPTPETPEAPAVGDEPLPTPETPAEPAPGATGPVLGVFAHPDDAEISAGGSMARWAAEGRAVHLLVLTNGDRGSQDAGQDRTELARIRAVETADAAKVAGLAGTRILSIPDGELANTRQVQAEIALEIRRLRPAILLTCDPTAWFFGNRYYNHSDHRTAGAVALDAVFPGAGNPHFFSEQLQDGLEPWNVPEVWLGWTLDPNTWQDVSGYMQTKLAALRAHRSQVEGDMLGFFEEWLPLEASENGRKIGVEHAEAFRVLQLG